METVQTKTPQASSPKREKIFVVAQMVLRTLDFGATLTASILIFTSNQTTTFFGIQIDAKYSYSPVFRFFAFANVVASGFSLLSLIFVSVLYYQGSNPRKFFFLFYHDLMITVLVMAACASATAIGYVGRHGNSHTGWMPICDHFGKFCNRVKDSLIFSYLALLTYLILTVFTVNALRTTLDELHGEEKEKIGRNGVV